MIDKTWIGRELGTSTLALDATRLRFFAKAIGETDPVYLDEDAARAAGHAGLPAPPTFLFAAELDDGATDRMLANLGVPIADILHGEQRFAYHRVACAGDTIRVDSRIADIYAKKGGALEFIVRTSRATDQHDALVAEMTTVIVVKGQPA